MGGREKRSRIEQKLLIAMLKIYHGLDGSERKKGGTSLFTPSGIRRGNENHQGIKMCVCG